MSATQLQTLTSVSELRDGSETQSIAENAQSSESHDRLGASRWAVLSAAFGITFIAVGMPNSFGVFQEYYESTLFPNKPSPEIIIIGSLSSSLYMILGAFTGRLADVVGYQVVLISGSVLIVGGLFAASVSTQFYQLVLSQGLAFGLGTALVYYPAVSSSGQYFRRHGLVNGVVLSGGALGGCIGPYSVRIMIQRLGLPATFRTLAAMSAGVLTFSCIAFTQARRRPRPRSRKLIDLRLLRDTRFLVILVSGTVAMTGFLPRYFIIPASAVSQGIDKGYGKLTALITSFVLCGVGHVVFWLPAVMVGDEDEKPVALMTLFVIFVGLLGSGFVSLIPVVMSDLFGAEDLASKVGLLNSIMGLGAFAGPSAVYAIVSDGRDFSMAVLFSGLLMIVGGLMLTRMYSRGDKASASRHPDRTPSTSPPPQPIPETFLIPGYDHDDIYRMVEDEFLVIAGKFTAHLHAAEYHRLKTQARSQNADAIADISRPVVGSLTELARRRQEDLLRRKRQRQALRQSRAGDGGEAGETEEEDDALWRGSSLRGLMDSPRKREVRISALARAESSAGRAGAGWDREGGVQRRLNFAGEGAVKRPRLEDTADEDEDDLDVPARSRSSPQRMAELTSSRPKATGFQAATLSPGHAKSAPAKSAAKGDNATVETMAPKKVENTNDQRDSDSEEDDIFTRFKSRQTSDRRRRPVAQRKAEGKGDTKGDIIPSFMS
ncbi:hypothetical protein VDGE_10181 [Verticillium dahliae]|uniref:Major facilitator superfamily (MFS) profile domain-containing protein n=1 Tax=Verticillium dahliae TaxID=27337 RepID=A0A444S587_VERDA|nr:hypothetical protein VDGE_10181 [Verticillium dahliae]